MLKVTNPYVGGGPTKFVLRSKFANTVRRAAKTGVVLCTAPFLDLPFAVVIVSLRRVQPLSAKICPREIDMTKSVSRARDVGPARRTPRCRNIFYAI